MSETTDPTTNERDVIARLAGRGEQTLSRLAELPGGAKAVSAMNDLRSRVDELGRRMRGVDELEQRVGALELEVAELKQAQQGAAGPPTP